MKTQNKTCYITIVEWHREYEMPKTYRVHIRERWNGFDYEHIINDAMSILTPDTPKITNKQLFDIMNKHCFDESIADCNRLATPCKPIDVSHAYCVVHEISGTLEYLTRFAYVFQYEIIKRVQDVSGDDDYFDYFPNYVEMFYDVCVELNLKKLYIEMYDKICAPRQRYADDANCEQCIPIWPDDK